MAKLSLASNSWDQYLQRSHWAGLLSSGYMRNFTFWSYEEKLWPLITEGIKLKPIWALRAVTVGVTRRTNPSSQLPSPLPTQAVQDITLKSMLAFLPWWESSRKAQRAQAVQVRHTWQEKICCQSFTSFIPSFVWVTHSWHPETTQAALTSVTALLSLCDCAHKTCKSFTSWGAHPCPWLTSLPKWQVSFWTQKHQWYPPALPKKPPKNCFTVASLFSF